MESVVQSDGSFEIIGVNSGPGSDTQQHKSKMNIQTSESDETSELIRENSGPGSDTQQHQKFKNGSCDKNKMSVQTSAEAKKDKKNCCLYCLKLQSKLARHIITLHKDQIDVQDLLKFAIGSKERKFMLDSMKKKGNHEFNTNPKLNNGQLIVSRRPNPKFHKSATDFSTCYNCLGTFTKSNIRHHACSRTTVRGDRSSVNLGRMVEGRVHSKASVTLQTVLSVLNEDDITKLIKYDWLLISFGNELCEKYNVHYQHNMIRSRLRLLGRALHELKKIEPKVTDFASAYHPEYCNSVIQAIRILGGFNSINNLFRTPASASNAVTQMKQVGKILLDECISNQDKKLKEQTDDFLFSLTSRAATRINKLVMDTQAKMRREKTEILPSTDDITIFKQFLDQKRRGWFELLDKKFSLKRWRKLSEVTMASVILFNRRRTGEMQNSEVSDFVGREKVNENARDQLFLALPDAGKERVQKYSRMKIRGKKGRTVPVLLHQDLEKCIDLIIKHRKAAGISSKNKLLFALPSTCNR